MFGVVVITTVSTIRMTLNGYGVIGFEMHVFFGVRRKNLKI